ncbi:MULTISPECIES: hypothetical protein [unclassified Colwellia]|uniref:hypothetical protein n=1 Tax=unclassified Colwellia TaxID=196834 RepID=UPI0015F4A7CC|nr:MULTISPECIES: hypothetical protein [unclassified Colwellia]MBA6381283.1 hypothetical protein [Colwellia sp. BRX10-7]MBA6389032.1 hypothetical protein [Colwellia sp. BRX10-2]MBA6403712.1 hypothetical protein [Colwellia sp. BRX10-5]MBA6407359.1 hypothetical protein [Colwellia sp. BRX10-1]
MKASHADTNTVILWDNRYPDTNNVILWDNHHPDTITVILWDNSNPDTITVILNLFQDLYLQQQRPDTEINSA